MTCTRTYSAHDGANVRRRVVTGHLPSDFRNAGTGVVVREFTACDGCASVLVAMGYAVVDDRRDGSQVGQHRRSAFGRLLRRRAA